MREKFLVSFFSIVITLGCVTGGHFVLAWAEPQMAPPAGNVPAPLNVSEDGQSKAGGLGLGGVEANDLVGLSVTGETFAISAVKGSGETMARALIATSKSAADFIYFGNDPAVNITSEKAGLDINSAEDFGMTSHGKAGGIFAADSLNVNVGYLGMSLGFGVFGQGQSYGGHLSGMGNNSSGLYATGEKYGAWAKASGVQGVGVLAQGKTAGLKAENSVKGYYVEAATKDYALKAVKDEDTYVVLGDGSGYGLIVEGGIKAAAFEGGVDINGNLFVSGSCSDEEGGCFGDLAENIDTALNVEVGDIVEINEQGFVEKAKQAYSKKAIGVISDPAIVFPGAQINPDLKNVKRQPLALTGLVSVKVSNTNGPIEIGDYITSSSIPGYGMKAITSGPVIGKALQAFDKNRGSMIILLDLDWIGSVR